MQNLKIQKRPLGAVAIHVSGKLPLRFGMLLFRRFSQSLHRFFAV
jgi:hypothetical protein